MLLGDTHYAFVLCASLTPSAHSQTNSSEQPSLSVEKFQTKHDGDLIGQVYASVCIVCLNNSAICYSFRTYC